MSARFISVTNFERLQHYRFRNPPWVKLYKALLDSKEFRALSLDSRAVLIHLHVIASRCGNRIPLDVVALKDQIGISQKKTLNLSPLLAGGFIEMVDEVRVVLESPAELWPKILNHFQQFHGDFGWHYTTPQLDAKVIEAVEAIGGWSRISKLRNSPRDESHARREFMTYMANKNGKAVPK